MKKKSTELDGADAFRVDTRSKISLRKDIYMRSYSSTKLSRELKDVKCKYYHSGYFSGKCFPKLRLTHILHWYQGWKG